MAILSSLSVLLLLLLIPSAGGVLWKPAATHVNPGNELEIGPEIDPAFLNKTWSTKDTNRTQMFADALPQSNFTTLRDIADRLNFECSDVKLRKEPVDVRTINSIRLKQNGTAHGPCEMWLDSTRVFNASDCATDDKGRTKLFPVPYSTCHGVCAFSTYWLLLDQPKWELHRVCVAVVNTDGQASSAPQRRLMGSMLMGTIRPLTRNNLYGNLEAVNFFRTTARFRKSRRNPTAILNRPVV